MSGLGEPVSTREVIIAEAIHCFAESGFDGTSLNDIAAAVGIRRPSLLHHFPSKDALYSEVFERVLSDFVGPLEEVAATPVSGWDKVDLVLSSAFRLCADNPDHVRLIRREAIDGGVRLGIDLAAALAPMFEGAVGFLRREMDSGRFRVHDPAQVLVTGYGALLSSFSDAAVLDGATGPDALDPARLAGRLDHLLGFFRAALLAADGHR